MDDRGWQKQKKSPIFFECHNPCPPFNQHPAQNPGPFRATFFVNNKAVLETMYKSQIQYVKCINLWNIDDKQYCNCAQNRTFARSLSFLALFHGPPRSLQRVVASNCCETSHETIFVWYAWRGATPSVPSIPARRLEPWMKHVLKPWKKWHIMSSWANVRFCRKYTYTARTEVLPGEVRFDCAGPVFYAFWDIGGMAEWLTGFVSKRTKP